jgi:hypothetical protein
MQRNRNENSGDQTEVPADRRAPGRAAAALARADWERVTETVTETPPEPVAKPVTRTVTRTVMKTPAGRRLRSKTSVCKTSAAGRPENFSRP